MTFWAKRSEQPGHVEVRVTYGPVTIEVKEHAGHLRSFWGELGKVLEEAERDEPKEA